MAATVLLTGATGYVGGRLLRTLEESGRPVRCMVRRPEALAGRAAAQTEIVHGDILEPDSLREALADVATAYYLVHSMAAPGPFAGADRRGAENFAAAARESGVSRIVYLGGLGAEHDLSTHLDSRHEVGRILRESGVPTIEFRASVIIGSGSASFEIVRSLVDRMPVLLIPRWVVTHTQPIAIEDVLAYLLAALDLELGESRLVEIGGPDRVAYADLMREYARQAGLRRAVIRVPLATPRISGLWLSVVTPVYGSIGRELIESLRNDTLVHDGSSREMFPIRPRGFREAIERALANEDREFAETRWSDALSAYRGRNWGGITLGQRAVASRTIRVAASPEQTFAPIQRIGGPTGWYYGNGFWRLRGLIDKVVGGVGLRRGRRDPVRLAVGDTLDFWRVEAFEQDRLLRLAAEMKTPGRIWLQFEVDGDQAGTTLRQTAIFDPHGLAGLAYWYALYPIHYLIFEGMLRKIGQAASASAAGSIPGAATEIREGCSRRLHRLQHTTIGTTSECGVRYTSARIPIVGRDRVSRLLIGLGKHVHDLGRTIEAREIHGQPGAQVYPSQTSVLDADLRTSLVSTPDDPTTTTALLDAAAAECGPSVEFVFWNGLDTVPAYNEDVDHMPLFVALLKPEIAEADAILFATPEYNGSVPGAHKNALDWVSRPFDENPLRDKPVEVIGASQGIFGATWAQADLRKILHTIGARVEDHELLVAHAQHAFTVEGQLRDPKHAAALTSILKALLQRACRQAA